MCDSCNAVGCRQFVFGRASFSERNLPIKNLDTGSAWKRRPPVPPPSPTARLYTYRCSCWLQMSAMNASLTDSSAAISELQERVTQLQRALTNSEHDRRVMQERLDANK